MPLTPADPGFSDAQALAALLTTEGFLLAAVALAVNLDAPGQERARDEVVPFRALAIGAAVALTVAGVGAIVVWGSIFLRGDHFDLYRAVIAICLIIPIVAQPTIALLLSFGSKTS